MAIESLEYQHKNHHSNLRTIEKNKILSEIKYFQDRLKTIGYTGDCAYEKQLSGFYQDTIARCKEKLLQYEYEPDNK